MKRTWLAAAVLCLAVTAAGADPRLLLRGGALAEDGVAVSDFTDLHAASPDRLVFRATSDAIFAIEPGGVRRLIASGDPLPAPLAGTFVSLGTPAVTESGRLVFGAAIRAEGVDEGLFALDGAILTLLTTDVGPATIFAANDAGQVLFGRNRLELWQDGRSTRVVSRRDAIATGRIRRIEHAALSPSGVVAVTVRAARDAYAILRWENGTPSTVAVAYSYGARQAPPVAIDAAGRIAYATADGPFVETAAGVLQRVAAVGDLVGDEPIVGTDAGLIAIDAEGRIAFTAALPSGDAVVLADGVGLQRLADATTARSVRWAPVLAAGSTVAWRHGDLVGVSRAGVEQVTDFAAMADAGWRPAGFALTAAGTAIVRTSRGGVYELEDGRVRALVRRGDAIEGVGRIDEMHAVAAHQDTVAVGVVTVDGTSALVAAERGRPFRPLVLEESTDLVYGLGDVLAVGRGPRARLVMDADDGTSALVEVRPGRPPRTLLRLGDVVTQVQAIAPIGPATLLNAVDAQGRTALRILDRGRLRTIARAPVDGFFDPPVIGARRTILVERYGPRTDDGTRQTTLDVIRPGARRRMPVAGDETLWAAAGDGNAVVALVSTATAGPTLFRLGSHGRRRALLAPGDALPWGGSVDVIDTSSELPVLAAGAVLLVSERNAAATGPAIVAVPAR